MPNLFAYIVLFSYPLVVIVLFKRLTLPKALVWSIMGGYLFLPENTGINLPLLPTFNKLLIPSMTAALMCFLTPPPVQPRRAAASPGPTARTRTTTIVRQSKLANLCLVMMFLSPIGIAITNPDPIFIGPRFIPGIRIYDIFAMMLNAGVMLLPFLLARRHLATHEAHMELLRAFVVAGLVCSVLVLIEVRMSPQLNRWIYGFHAHLFGQHIRAGGFRPMLFIEHGLRVGVFMLMCCLAALTLYKVGRAQPTQGANMRTRTQDALRTSGVPIYVFLWLFWTLFIVKSLGAFIIGCLFVPVMFLTQARRWRLLAGAAALAVLLYPMARSAELVPVDRIHSAAQSISEDRARSFKFRLDNEDLLLARASEKALLGWGGWGRWLIYDPVSGRREVVPDGIWVIVFGVSGWVGYLAQFGLLTLPAFAFFFVRGPLATSIASQGLCLMLAANLIDLIPNSGLTPISWMVAGALLGRFERRDSSDEVPVAAPNPRQRSGGPAPRPGSQAVASTPVAVEPNDPAQNSPPTTRDHATTPTARPTRQPDQGQSRRESPLPYSRPRGSTR